jgi:glycosyltransferase involved in cell wall biosynthesis
LNFPPEPTGIAPYTGALAIGLQEIGYQVFAHVAHPHYPEWKIYDGYGQWTRTEDYEGIKLYRRRHYVPRLPRGAQRLLSELTFGMRLLTARWGNPQLAIAVSPSLFSTALAALRIRTDPRRPALIVWVQDIYTLGLAETGEGGGLAENITRWVEANTLRVADHVVAIHPRFAQYAIEHLSVDPSKITVIRNWAHLQADDPKTSSAAKSALGWPSDVTLAVHTGNMGAKQGLQNIIEAARLADETRAPVHFVLVGDGGEREKLVDRARGISRITFVNPLSDRDYLTALSASDVLLVNEKPGVSAMAVPSKLTSYFHAGRPVIAATDLNGITASEIAASEAGIVVPAGEPATLLSAILELSADANAAATFAGNGRRYRDAVLSERAALEQWAVVVRSVIDSAERR